uniref:Uncharacterized protein n=1 Tax=Ditylenchus dipsaci TaxID=166011 RepID=A0A915EQL2_9BILA
MTKRRQSADREAPSTLTASAARSKASRPLRTEELDVERLNLLIKTLDKAWVMPKLNAKEPVGSNFQYKKTCANIFKARHQACQQPGFGIMCFNFCYEQGEPLIFKCEDVSDASYCKSNAHYDDFLTKYRKDAYRAKAYIHQMISRCYSTSVCNGARLLNSTLTPSKAAHPQSKDNRPAVKSTSGRPKRPMWSRLSSEKALQPDGNEAEEREMVTPKYVPFWQRLLTRKTTKPAIMTTTTTAQPTIWPEAEPQISDVSTEQDDLDLDYTFHTPNLIMRDRIFIPVNSSSSSDPYKLLHTKYNKFGGSGDAETTEGASPFWNKFQPGRWYQSIHYMTPTG